MRNFRYWQEMASESHADELRCALERTENNERVAAETEKRYSRISELNLQAGCLLMIKEGDSEKCGKFDSIEENGCRIWVRGIDPLTPENPRLCCPFKITSVIVP